jgi:hypothetical protein
MQSDGIAGLGTFGRQKVLNAGAKAVDVFSKAFVIEVVTALISARACGKLGRQTVNDIKLTQHQRVVIPIKRGV